MKRHKLTGWEWALFATPLLSLAGLILPAVLTDEPLAWRYPFLNRDESSRKGLCQGYLKDLSIALLCYSQDYDYKYPPAIICGVSGRSKSYSEQHPAGWADAVNVLLRNQDRFECPSNPVLGPFPLAPSSTSYWFNANLSAFPLSKLKRPSPTLLCGDGNDGREVADGTYSKTTLPPQWLNDYSSPCYRHLGGANYAFADGHVKWLKPSQISTAPGADYTFSTR